MTKTTLEKDNNALNEEAELISNFAGCRIELSMPPSSTIGGRAALSFKKGPGEYGVYVAPDSDLIEQSGEGGDKTARALLQHEGAHVWLTNFDALEEIIKNLSEKYNMPPEFVRNIENIVEDCRIESIWSIVFPGSKRNFSELYKVTIDEIEERTKTTPIDFAEALLIARFGLAGGDIIWLESRIPEQVRPYYERFAQELEKVKNTDWRGTQIVTDNILNIFKEIYKDTQHQKQGTDGFDEGGKDSVGEVTESEQSQEKSGDESTSKQAEAASRLLLKLMPLLGDINAKDNKCKRDSNVKNEVNAVSNASKEKTLAESRKALSKLLDSIPLSKYSIANQLNASINPPVSDRSFNNKSHGINGEGIVNTYDGSLKRYNGEIKPNPNIKKMLEEIELWNKPKNWYNSTSGPRLDIHKLIRHEITKDPADISKPYLKRIKNAGAEIWVLLDVSGSMEGDGINTAKKILGSIYDSLLGSRYVSLKMYGFYNDEVNHVFEMDRDLLMQLDAGGGTPTDMAIYYITELMKKDHIGFDKTLFIITDGYPNDGDSTKNALMHLKSSIKNVYIYTIFVSPKDEEAVNIFSPSDWYFNVSSINDVEGVLERGIGGIVDNIKKQLRRDR